MPLNIEVKGEPGSIRSTAGWLRSTSGSVDDAGGEVAGARTQSEDGWTGQAGEGFRGVMSRVAGKVNELAGDMGSTAGALNRHADDLDTVKSRMAQARQIASDGGLETTETSIAEPGPAPPAPPRLPTGREPTAGERQAHVAALDAEATYVAKVRAYQEAGRVVNEARRKEVESQNHLVDFLRGQAESSPFTIANFATGLAAYHVERTSKFRWAAERYADKARRAARLLNNPRHAGRGALSRAWRRAAVLHAQNQVNANEAARRATATRLARAVDRLPPRVKRLVRANAADLLPNRPGGAVLRNASRALRRVPVVGTVITAVGIGYDIATGNDPGRSIASGVSAAVAGAVVGTAVGGPVGLVLGTVVGAGVGYGVDEWYYDAVGADIESVRNGGPPVSGAGLLARAADGLGLFD
ncbi:MAG: hypothetical protein GEV03_19290 [Streptosporangiales bacterium]|nr:hypothetical protein [Streptosporangiales bacterium]